MNPRTNIEGTANAGSEGSDETESVAPSLDLTPSLFSDWVDTSERFDVGSLDFAGVEGEASESFSAPSSLSSSDSDSLLSSFKFFFVDFGDSLPLALRSFLPFSVS